jgi:DNA-binding MarR family transcriptional regulator/N-acetylglutamate synthase-like GNAT family acetyltransferase
MCATPVDLQIAKIREFNRFYTARLGLLRKRHLDGEFSLTEARILYEVGASPGITAAALCEFLGLDAGYVSRLLSALTRRKLIRQLASSADARQKLLNLTAAGTAALARLNAQSDTQIDKILSDLDTSDRDLLVAAIGEVHRILAATSSQSVRILRVTNASTEALEILEEYYEAVHVVKRDAPGSLQNMISEPNSAMWLAYIAKEVVGCVVLRNLSPIPNAGECKRLYVRPSARGRSVATLLLDTLEEYARKQKVEWIYLDTYDDLKPAIALYERRGYQFCERYNDNPQATLFMRKCL